MWRFYTSTGNEKLLQGPQVLGSFTQAQWPPTNPNFQDVAILADTYGAASAATFQWPLEYRPDLDGTYPWRAYNGSTPSSAYVEYVLTQSGANIAYVDAGTFQLPLAGQYKLDIAVGGYTSGTESLTAALGTSSAAHDIATATTTAFGHETLSTSFTATKGQTIHVTYTTSGSGTAALGLIVVRMSPVKVANA